VTAIAAGERNQPSAVSRKASVTDPNRSVTAPPATSRAGRPTARDPTAATVAIHAHGTA
jgi:hypothetical protein